MNTTDITPYANVISDHIKSSSYSQKALAEKLGISLSTLSSIAHGHREPKLGTLLGLANALHLSLDELTGYTVPVIVHPEVTELSPAQVTQMEHSLIHLYSALLEIENFKQSPDTTEIVTYVQECIQQILNGQKLKGEEKPELQK